MVRENWFPLSLKWDSLLWQSRGNGFGSIERMMKAPVGVDEAICHGRGQLEFG